MRPVLKPGLRRVWRNDETLQLGLDPDHAVVLTGVDPAVARFIESLDRDDARAASARHGLAPLEAKAVLQILADAGALVDADRVEPRPDGDDSPEDRRLQPDLRARSVLAGDTDPGTAVRQARRRALVCVVGAGRVGAGVATLLGAAGVGTVTVLDDQVVTEADITPLGFLPGDVGSSRGAALRRRISELAPSTRPSRRVRRRPDLVILAPAEETDRATTIGLVRDGVPHLVTAAREVTAVVGPLVLPGRSACLHCLDLHRTDRDPGWPNLLTQLQSSTTALAGDVALAGLTASLTALHALAFLEGRNPTSVNGTLTIGLPDGAIRRRSWRPHPACGCCWEHLAAPPVQADEPALF